jgi:hypothetical protein
MILIRIKIHYAVRSTGKRYRYNVQKTILVSMRRSLQKKSQIREKEILTNHQVELLEKIRVGPALPGITGNVEPH